MIERIEVEGFKSLAKTSIELGSVNVFVGANGVGKSNVLEAIGMLSAAADGQVDDQALVRRGVRLGSADGYRTSFRGETRGEHIGLEARGFGSRYAVRLRHSNGGASDGWEFDREEIALNPGTAWRAADPRTPWIDLSRGLAKSLFHEESGEHAAVRLLAALRGYRIYAPDTRTLRGLVIDAQQEAPIGLSGGRLADAVASTLEHLAPDRADAAREAINELLGWVESFEVAPSSSVPMSRAVPSTPYVLKFRDRFMSAEQPFVSGYDASEGAVIVLFMMVLALHPAAPKIFAVDNFDHGLNPRLARAMATQVVEWILASDDRQVMLTAHNPLVLDGLPLQDERVRLFTVDRTNTGKTAFRRIVVDEAMMRSADEGWSLSRMWVAGMLGGVPDV